MIHLKVILYAILAFIERNPKFCLVLLLIGVFAPVVFKVVGWVILGIIVFALIAIGLMMWRVRRMQHMVEREFRSSTSGNRASGSGFGGFSGAYSAHGMSLEELVRRMQAEADARKAANGGAKERTTNSGGRVSSDGKPSREDDYVDFEEVK